eukprot:GFUD01024396.1.p1 GENE.GFUD01024396.1~~GFUD01024396.1.p1  ORF type:complete len:705 (-),score=224.81 GFUD01024396.1:69-2183(-)
MDHTRRCEPSLSDSSWYSNLQLLGYGDQVSPAMFDYPNPAAFQQVFFYLFNLLNKEKVRTEFRDCWPILDKKQEAEFRRKVVNLVKEYQKEYPMDLPYTNPSLFQSPGGRRFVAFLHVFSNFVLKMFLEKFDVELLSKPSTKNKKLGKICFTGLVRSTKAALENASDDQASMKETVRKSKESAKKIGVKYFDIKEFLEESQENELIDVKRVHSEMVQQGSNHKEKLLSSYDEKCNEIKELQSALRDNGVHHENLWTSIMMVDDSVPKLKLNFDEFPAELVAVDNMKMTFENMIAKVVSTVGRVLEFKPQAFPIKEMALGAATFTSQAHQLTKLQADLGLTVGKMMENVQVMLNTSSQIDWANCELAISRSSSYSTQSGVQTVLLPPTPSLLEDLQKPHPNDLQQGIPSHLQLLSPSPTTPHPTLTIPPGSALSCTPISTGQVMRRFPRRIAPDQSPLLRQSLIQSTLLRAGGELLEEVRGQDTTKTEPLSEAEYPGHGSRGSLSDFSPVLSSTTKSPSDTFSRPSSSLGVDGDRRPSSSLGLVAASSSSFAIPSPTFGSLRAAADASLSLDCTQSKIEMYRKILLSAKNKEKPRAEGNSSLLSAWNCHRQSLSPQGRPAAHSSSSSPTSPSAPGQFSPLQSYRTPDMSHRRMSVASPGSEEMDSKMVTRLDQLMTSLTLSNDSLDFSLGRMSFGGDELLSPHCT